MKASISLAILFASLFAASAEDWPRFRGPQGSGLSQAARIPVEFGPEKNLAWKVDLAPGHSSPVVCGNQLYLTSFNNDLLRTHALDVQTGKTLWVADLPRERTAKQHQLNNAASPTPACDAAGVVVYFADFGLAAWTRGGNPGWRIPLPALVNNHGMASSPVLTGDRVIQVLGSDTGSEVQIYSRASGKLTWRDTLAGVTYATPVVTQDAQVIVVSTGEVVAFDVKSGKRRWWMTGVPYQPKSSPILSVDGKLVYFAVLSIDEASRTALSSYEKLLQQFDVNGDGQITAAEIRERKGPAGAFAQIDLDGDGVFTQKEQEAIMLIAEIRHTAGALPTDGAGD